MSASVKIYRCKVCTRPLNLSKIENGIVKCASGHENHIVDVEEQPEIVNPLTFSKSMASDYIDLFKQQTEENPKDTNALYGMGLVYLGLKNYELAQRNFKMAVDLSPMEPDLYYYYALSLFEGRNPKYVDEKDPQRPARIEEWLHTATNMQKKQGKPEKRKHLILLMVLRQGAFVENGKQFIGESPMELLEKIKKMPPEQNETVEIEEHVRITEGSKLKGWLEQLDGQKSTSNARFCKPVKLSSYFCPCCGMYELGVNEDGTVVCKNCDNIISYDIDSFNSLDADACVCTCPSGRDYNFSTVESIPESINGLVDEEKRVEFFENLYPPEEPVLGTKPKYPVGNLLIRLIIMVVVSVILLVVELIGGWSMEDYNKPITVHEKFESRYSEDSRKQMKAAECKEKIAKLQEDSIAQATKDSIFFADYKIFAYKLEGDENGFFGSPSEEEMTRLAKADGYLRSWSSLVVLLILLMPLIVFILKTIIRFSRCSRERKQIEEDNNARVALYNARTFLFENRATIKDYVTFCRHYLARKSPFLEKTGDPVTKALKDERVDELSMAGKVFFVNYFEYEDDDKNPTQYPDLVLRNIFYVIGILQADKLILLKNCWDTTRNEMSECDSESIFYRNMTGAKVIKNSDTIEIGMVGGAKAVIKLPPEGRPSLMYYQDENPNDEMSFSNTRTSNPQDFVDALNNLSAKY